MKFRYTFALGAPLMGANAMAADLNVTIDVPQIKTAEYHKPYLAVWVEKPDQTFAANLAVLYDLKKKDNAGTKWLKDMRQWWRKSGRDLTMPVDGVSGATRAPGEHTFGFSQGKAPLGNLPAGEYQLVVEASREAGGREVVKVPFTWPAKTAKTTTAQGQEELGKISVQVKP